MPDLPTPSPRGGRYQVLRDLGQGGEKRVVLARDRLAEREVVLQWGLDDDGGAALHAEARRLAGLAHPGLATIEDLYFDRQLARWVAVFPWLEGRDLDSAEISIEGLLVLADDLIDALSWLHAAGLRHGDVKPANVLVAGDPDRPRSWIIDFGLAAEADAPELPGSTPAFLPPELHAGSPPSAAMDWFALGLTIRRVLERLEPLAPSPERAALERIADELLEADPEVRRAAIAARLRSRREIRIPETVELPADSAPTTALLRSLLETPGNRGAGIVEAVALRGDGLDAILRGVVLDHRATGQAALLLEEPGAAREIRTRLLCELGAPGALEAPSSDAWADALRFAGPEETVLVAVGPAVAASPAGGDILAVARALAGARRTRGWPRLLLLVGRETEVPEQATLPPLSPRDLRRLLDRWIPGARPEEAELLDLAAATLGAKTGGRPGRFRRALAAAIETGALRDLDGRLVVERRKLEALEVPPDRAATPPELLPLVASLAANCGALDHEALAAITGRDLAAVEDELRRLLRLGIVRDAGRRRRPALLSAEVEADGTGGATWPTTRPARDPRDLVARDAAAAARLEPWLEGADPAALLAHVRRATGSFRLAASAPALSALGARAALAAGLPDEAERLIGALDPGGLRARLEAELAQTRGDLEGAVAALARAVVEHPSEAPALLPRLAFLEILAGRTERALERLDRVLELELEPAERARALTARGSARARAGDLDGGREDLNRALRSWVEADLPAAAAACRGNLGALEQRAGNAVEAERLLADAVETLEDLGSADQLAGALTNHGVTLAALGRREEAAARHGRAAMLFLGAGDRARAAAAAASRGIALYEDGALLAAYEALDAAFSELDRPGDARARALAGSRLVRAALLLGRRRAFRAALASVLGESALDPREADRLRRLDRDDLADLFGVVGDPEAWPWSDDPADPLTRWTADARTLESALRERDRPGALEALGRLRAATHSMEQDMSERQRTLFRAAVVHPAYEALERRLERLAGGATRDEATGFAALVRAVHDARTLDEALGAIVEQLVAGTPAVRAFVVRGDADSGFQVAAAAGADRSRATAELSTAVLRDAANRREAVIVADAGDDERLGFAPSVRRLGLRSVACLPLETAEGLLGLLYLDTPLEEGAFDRARVAELAAYADLASRALDLFLRAREGESAARRLRREITSRERTLATRTRELQSLRERFGEGTIPGASPAMRRVNEILRKVAPTTLGILVLGETGSGKELAARAIHRLSERRDGPFIAVNAAALPENLVESELFGHEKGAFSGAVKAEPGLFRLAEGGTLFLDEIGELSLDVQAKFLRVLESGVVRPLGGRRDHRIDVRIVAATHRDLRDDAAFRQDLYFRLATFVLELPPLRERSEDIPQLVDLILRRAGRRSLRFEAEALEALLAHDWPGNVRELENVVTRLAIFVGDARAVRRDDLPEEIRRGAGRRPPSLAEAVREAVEAAMAWAEGNKAQAAEVLGVSRTTLYKKLEDYGL